MDGIAIASGFLERLQKDRNLGHSAFVAACHLSEDRYRELESGSTPSAQEIIHIVAGFNLTDGIPMVPRSQKLVA